MAIKQTYFISTLEKYIKMSLIPKKIILQINTLNKIIKIIKDKYYEQEYDKINKNIKFSQIKIYMRLLTGTILIRKIQSLFFLLKLSLNYIKI